MFIPGKHSNGFPEYEVTHICFASGFGSLPHFERAFKRKFGRTPRESRKPV